MKMWIEELELFTFDVLGLAKKFANPPSGQRTERRKKTSTNTLDFTEV